MAEPNAEPNADPRLEIALRGGDIDELLRLVDARCATRDWDGLATLRDRCARAHETGHQLWPAAAHAAYRLALEAPGAFAADVLVDEGARFALGPLPEVAAQDHAWGDLAPHLHAGPAAVLTAHERVLRGEDLVDVEPPGPAVLELPLRLESWEPRYALAEYRAHDADFPMPSMPPLEPVELPAPPTVLGPDDTTTALRELVRAWTAGSDGRVELRAVTGDALEAIASFGLSTARVAPLESTEALALLGWAGASGGAHGRRSGAAAGRFGAWWVAATVAGLVDEWPDSAERLGDALTEMRWLAWVPAEGATGWRLHLAVEHPGRGRAWAVAAVDAP